MSKEMETSCLRGRRVIGGANQPVLSRLIENTAMQIQSKTSCLRESAVPGFMGSRVFETGPHYSPPSCPGTNYIHQTSLELTERHLALSPRILELKAPVLLSPPQHTHTHPSISHVLKSSIK